ncbi:HK97-gp10 family putative phage morphogenesis protein [Jeotgalibaca porci]|uniref:HK97-gp10 family putative phage morphogenesis protein n=1 Tax=Jeotgalibaca porci TaxID=1868793 RepID=UPI0035A0749F
MANNMIRFEGADEFEGILSKAFKQAPDIANKVIKNTTEKGMAKAKRLAPRDTWFLHDNIYTEYKPLSGYVHSPASYSGYQEFGTRYMSAQPFMRPMMQWLAPQFERDMKDAMEGTLR